MSAAIGRALPEWRVTAINGATQSENNIHDNAVARQYGFEGGLVPGVTVHAYMVRPALDALGPEWLSRGTFSTRFLKPFYEGDAVTVSGIISDEAGVPTVDLEARNAAGTLCATATATLPGDVEQPAVSTFPRAPLPALRPPVSDDVLRGIDVLGTVEQPWERIREDEHFLSEIQDDHAAFRGDSAVLHPGYLIRWANSALDRNVMLGAWIHVSSEVQHLSTVAIGEGFETRARIVDLFERKGHKFVTLDVLTVAGERPVYRCRHTAIYDIRKVADS